jgi:nucleotidyltransferase/DNA polymerase involved in DNA repair
MAFSSERDLSSLVSVGPAMLRDFELLGIRSVKQLARRDPAQLYRKLCALTGQRIDICCQDVFTAAVAQARNPLLPPEQCQWWYWSRQRKARHAR